MLWQLSTFVKWLDEQCVSGFTSALVTTREVAGEAGIDKIFKITRRQRKKTMFSYKIEDEAPKNSLEDNIKLNQIRLLIHM